MKEYVIAIDLGTSRTAYSWKSVADPDPQVGVPDKGREEVITRKSPTTLLIGGKTGARKAFTPCAAEAYGNVAESRYAEGNIPLGAQLFKRFKMQLHDGPSQIISDDLINGVAKSASKSAEMMLLEVFVMALKYIKDAALSMISSRSTDVKVEDVTWVLTVPVCCSDPAKHFMRQAAIQGGLIKGGDDDEDLVLCMEPKAACLALGERLSWKTDDKYLVVDCGGGTVDISAFRVEDAAEGGLAEVVKATSGAWGCTYVDEQLEGFLEDFVRSVASHVGETSLKSFFKSTHMYRILQEWEREKVILESVDDSIHIDLKVLSDPKSLGVEMAQMDEGRKLENRGGEQVVAGHGTWDLELLPALLNKFFKPHCDSIAQAVSEQLEKKALEGLTSVVMVGGFADSVHVQAAVQACVNKKYPDNSVKMLVATSPDLAIVQGAAHYVKREPKAVPRGRSAQYPVADGPRFNSHISSNSYGILITEEFGGEGKIFDTFFLQGESYESNHVERRNYRVKSNMSILIDVSSCDSREVKPGINKLDVIRGSGALYHNVFSVSAQGVEAACGEQTTTVTETPTPARKSCWPRIPCWSRNKSASSDPVPDGAANNANVGAVADGIVNIVVEFTLTGVDLHVKVQIAQGNVLLQKAVPFDSRFC